MIAEVKKYFIHQSEIYGKDFYLDLKDYQKGELSKSCTKRVFGSGPTDAKLMCIVETPNKEDDKPGEHFGGAEGELLIKILAAIKFSREEIYIAKIINSLPPENRDQEESEIADCLPFLKQQIELIKPVVILALGQVAAQSLLGVSESIVSFRAKENQYNGIPVFVTHPPAALLSNPALKRATWEDVQKLRKVFDSIAN